MPSPTHVVTGAFGFTGRHIARHLLARGVLVRTLISHPNRPNPFGDAIEVAGLDFGDPAALTACLHGADVLYNTYWVRFPRGATTFEVAVQNSRTLLRAARDAGVRRVVHISVTQPSLDSPLPYFRGKAQVEQAVIESGLSYAILRPALVSGIIDWLVHDVILTREEVLGLLANLLVSDQPPLGRTRLCDWLAQNAETVGRRYASELQRHYH